MKDVWSGLRLASTNKIKRSLFETVETQGEKSLVTPLFDEEKIKLSIEDRLYDGPSYFAENSILKLSAQRQALRESEGSAFDYAVLVADSGCAVNLSDGRMRVINRDEPVPKDEMQEILNRVNQEGKIDFFGSVAFGSKNGQATYAITTYVTTRLNNDVHIDGFPISLSTLSQFGEEYEHGFISYLPDEGANLKPHRLPVFTSNKLDMGYISGLTPEVIKVANEVSLFARDTTPIIEDIIEEHPFNASVFRTLKTFYGPDMDLMTFYKLVMQSRKEIFNRYGGQCSLFALETAEKLLESKKVENLQVVLYPSWVYGHQAGHSGLIVDNPNGRFVQKYLVDTGLTIPHPVPLSSHIPFYPTKYANGKFVLTGVGYYNEDGVPDMLLQSSGGKRIFFPGVELLSLAQFEEKLPKILTELHPSMDHRIDFHRRDGTKRLAVTFKQGVLCIQNGERHELSDTALSSFLVDQRKESLAAMLGNSANEREHVIVRDFMSTLVQ